MKYQFAVAALLAAACAAPVATRSPAVLAPSSAASPRAAVDMLLNAVVLNDSRKLGAIWGTPDRLARDMVPAKEFEMRAALTMCALRHDSYVITREEPDMARGRAVGVRLTSGDRSRSTTIRTVPVGSSEWRVEGYDMRELKFDCKNG